MVSCRKLPRQVNIGDRCCSGRHQCQAQPPGVAVKAMVSVAVTVPPGAALNLTNSPTHSQDRAPHSGLPLTLPAPPPETRDQDKSLSLGEGEGGVRVAVYSRTVRANRATLSAASSEVGDVDRLRRSGALGHGVGEFHVAHA